MSNDRDAVNVKQAVPFFAVADMRKSVAYYVNGLGFTITNQWVDNGKLRWCWLQRGGAALMLQEDSQPTERDPRNGGITIYFICEDALALYHEAKERGLTVDRPFVGNGMWVTGLNDPDGYRIYFESDTDAPEESDYEG